MKSLPRRARIRTTASLAASPNESRGGSSNRSIKSCTEPLEGTQLEAGDLVGVARTLQRARAGSPLAVAVVEEALVRGAGLEGTRALAEIAKARGDKARALDFETRRVGR